MNSKTKWASTIMLLSSLASFFLTYFYINDKIEIASETFQIISIPLLLIFIISSLYYLILSIKHRK